MKTQIILNLNKDYTIPDYSTDFDNIEDNVLSISINTDGNISFKELISMNCQLHDSFLKTLSFLENYDIESTPEQLSYIKKICRERQYDFNIDSIYLGGDLEIINNFLLKNPVLSKYKIILDVPEKINSIDTWQNFINESHEVLRNFHNIYLITPENTQLVNLHDYKISLDYIDNIVNRIKYYNFSPFEQLIYIYDIVRSRVYTAENNNQDPSVSRDLTNVVLGDKIVCRGYTNLFNTIITRLGHNAINHSIIRADDSTKGHSRSLVYINDEKYNVHGLYFFDPTWDSKTNEADNSYLESYRFLSLTNQEINTISKKKYNDEILNYWTKDSIQQLIKLIYDHHLSDLTSQHRNAINYITNLVLQKQLISFMMIQPEEQIQSYPEIIKQKAYYDASELENSIIFCYQCLNCPIDIITKLKAIANVRKIQYYENPNNVKYDLNFLNRIYDNLTDPKTPEQKLYDLIFGNSVPRINRRKINKQVDLNLQKTVLNVRLARTLKSYTEQNGGHTL